MYACVFPSQAVMHRLNALQQKSVSYHILTHIWMYINFTELWCTEITFIIYLFILAKSLTSMKLGSAIILPESQPLENAHRCRELM